MVFNPNEETLRQQVRGDYDKCEVLSLPALFFLDSMHELQSDKHDDHPHVPRPIYPRDYMSEDAFQAYGEDEIHGIS